MKTISMPKSLKNCKYKELYLSEVSFLYKGRYHMTREVLSPTTSVKQILYLLGKICMKDNNPTHYRDVNIDTSVKLIRRGDDQLVLF